MIDTNPNYPSEQLVPDVHHTISLPHVNCGYGNIKPIWVELLGTYSYSLDGDENVKVAIPGVPSIYTPPEEYPLVLKPDEVGLIDSNGYRLPHGPMEPCIKAIDTLKRDNFDIKDIDLILDRNIIRNLSKLCQEHSWKLQIESAPGRCKGTVDKWFADRGFGFLKILSCEDQPSLVGQRVYCHIKQLFPSLLRINYNLTGHVSFTLEDSQRGPVATNVIELEKPGSYFKFGIIKCNNGTVVIRRIERVNIGESTGYGRSFEGAVEKNENHSNMGFWEINLFDIGGLKTAVRSEVDAVIPKDKDATTKPNWIDDSGHRESALDRRKMYDYDTKEGLISTDIMIKENGRDHMINIDKDYDSIELKCLSNFPRHMRQITDYISQMRLGNTKKLVMANHKRGVIEREPTIYSLDDFVEAANIPDDHRETYDYIAQVLKQLIATCEEGVPYRVELNVEFGKAYLYEDESARPISSTSVNNI